MEQSKVASAVETLIEELRKDPEYRRSWEANISIQFKEQFGMYNAYSFPPEYENVCKAADEAAKNFIDLLIYKPKTTITEELNLAIEENSKFLQDNNLKVDVAERSDDSAMLIITRSGKSVTHGVSRSTVKSMSNNFFISLMQDSINRLNNTNEILDAE